MESCKFLILIFLIFTFMEVLDAKLTSKINICKHDEPRIRFPFKVNSFCHHNQTMIKFPGYGALHVKSIENEIKKLNLIDPKDCVFEVFLNLDLYPTPFRYYHVVKNYTYLNCSMTLSGSFEQVPCLSGSRHHVYVVEPSLDVPRCCEVVKTVSIPFAYSSYVSDDSFGLELTWDSTGFEEFVEAEKRWFGFQSTAEELGFVILVFVVFGLACIKSFCSNKSQSKKYEWETSLVDLETL